MAACCTAVWVWFGCLCGGQACGAQRARLRLWVGAVGCACGCLLQRGDGVVRDVVWWPGVEGADGHVAVADGGVGQGDSDQWPALAGVGVEVADDQFEDVMWAGV